MPTNEGSTDAEMSGSTPQEDLPVDHLVDYDEQHADYVEELNAEYEASGEAPEEGQEDWRRTEAQVARIKEAIEMACSMHEPTEQMFSTHEVIFTPFISSFAVNDKELLINPAAGDTYQIDLICGILFHEAMHLHLHHYDRWREVRSRLDDMKRGSTFPNCLKGANGNPKWYILKSVWFLLCDAEANENLMWCKALANGESIFFRQGPLVGVPGPGVAARVEDCLEDVVFGADQSRLNTAVTFLRERGYLLGEGSEEGKATNTPSAESA